MIEGHSTLYMTRLLIRHAELVTVSALVLNHPPASSQTVKNVQAGWRITA